MSSHQKTQNIEKTFLKSDGYDQYATLAAYVALLVALFSHLPVWYIFGGLYNFECVDDKHPHAPSKISLRGYLYYKVTTITTLGGQGSIVRIMTIAFLCCFIQGL